MDFLGNIGVLEVAGHAMLDAVATAWVNLIALEEISSVMRTVHTWQDMLEDARSTKAQGIEKGHRS